jgi:hypothetical protein
MSDEAQLHTIAFSGLAFLTGDFGASTFLPPGFVWTIQLAAVVGGHMLGAWAGHVVNARESGAARGERSHRRREVPLAVIMVCLTTLTLWSLGQALVQEVPAGTPAAHAGSGAAITGSEARP